MGLQSGGDSFAMKGSYSGGAVLKAPVGVAGSSVLMEPLVGGGGGYGHTTDPVSGESRPASLALICSTRVPVCRPYGSIRICAVFLYVGLLGGDSSTGMTSTDLSLSSSSAAATSTTSTATMTPSSPSLELGDDNTVRPSATG
jgi:hypothetical protein